MFFLILVLVFVRVENSQIHTLSENCTFAREIVVQNIHGELLTDFPVFFRLPVVDLQKLQNNCLDVYVVDEYDEYVPIFQEKCGSVFFQISALDVGSQKTFTIYYQCSISNPLHHIFFEDKWISISTQYCPNELGWTRFDTLDGKFLRLDSNFSISFVDGTNHNHDIIGSTDPAGDEPDIFSYTLGGPTAAMSQVFLLKDHSHDMFITTDSGSTLPPYKDVIFCQSNQLEIFNGSISLGKVPPNEVDYHSFSSINSFMRGTNEYVTDAGGGSASHVHTFNGMTSIFNSPDVTTVFGPGDRIININHRHAFSGVTQESSNELPFVSFAPWMSLINHNILDLENITFLSTSQNGPPMGYEKINSHNGLFPWLENVQSYTSNGEIKHKHYINDATSIADSYVEATDDILFFELTYTYLHDHSFEFNTTQVERVPPYVSLTLWKRNEVNVNIGVYISDKKNVGIHEHESIICDPPCVNGNCFKFTNNDSSQCFCYVNYEGIDCNVPTCNPPCSGFQYCAYPDLCLCNDRFYTGGSCNIPISAGLWNRLYYSPYPNDMIIANESDFHRNNKPHFMGLANSWKHPYYNDVMITYGGAIDFRLDGMDYSDNIFYFNVSNGMWKWIRGSKTNINDANEVIYGFDYGNSSVKPRACILLEGWIFNDEIYIFGGRFVNGVSDEIWAMNISISTPITWKFIKGNQDISNTLPYFNIKGEFHINNTAGGLFGYVGHKINDVEFVLFGGAANMYTEQLKRDIWIFNIESSSWMLKNGDLLSDEGKVIMECNGSTWCFNEQNHPPCVVYAIGWFVKEFQKRDDTYFVYGGYRLSSESTSTLWKYSFVLNQWSAVYDNSNSCVSPQYQSQLVFDSNNHPPCQLYGAVSENANGYLLTFFGGHSNGESFNDFWIFQLDLNQWLYRSHLDRINPDGQFIIKNDPNNVPPEMYFSNVIKWDRSELIVLGGIIDLEGANSTYTPDDVSVMKFENDLAFNCYGKTIVDEDQCSGHGDCIYLDTCKCFEGYYGGPEGNGNCEYPRIFRWKNLKYYDSELDPSYGGTPNVFDASVNPGVRKGAIAMKMNEDEVMYFGGSKLSGTVFRSIFVYSIELNLWKNYAFGDPISDCTINANFGTKGEYNETNFPPPLAFHRGIRYNNDEIIFIGGESSFSNTNDLLDDIWMYDFPNNKFKHIFGRKGDVSECLSVTHYYEDVNIPPIVYRPTTVRIGNVLYQLGGQTSCGIFQVLLGSTETNYLFSFDLDVSQWKLINGKDVTDPFGDFIVTNEYHELNIIGPLFAHESWAVGNLIYTNGGGVYTEGETTPLSRLWTFDTQIQQYKCFRCVHFETLPMSVGIETLYTFNETIFPGGILGSVGWKISPTSIARLGGTSFENSIWVYDFIKDMFMIADMSIIFGMESIEFDGMFDHVNIPVMPIEGHCVVHISSTRIMLLGGMVFGGDPHSHWIVDYSDFFKCNGTLKDEGACSNNGECISKDTCICNEKFTGNDCEILICDEGYYGTQCEYFDCYGLVNENEEVCNNNGTCVSPNDCICNERYFGAQCELGPIYYCDGISALNTFDVCNGKGNCIADDICDCRTPYSGIFCEISPPSLCFGLAEVDPLICSGHGTCIDENECNCDLEYIGEQCEIPICFGEYENSKVCSKRGVCISANECDCFDGYFGAECELFQCFKILSNNSTVCSGKGNCVGNDICQCEVPSPKRDCGDLYCYGISSSHQTVCSGKGTCNATNECICRENYVGFDCSSLVCYGKNEHEYCNGVGTCDENSGTCVCPSGYSGIECNIIECFGKTDINACGYPNGHCIAPNVCECNASNVDGYFDQPECASCLFPYVGTNCTEILTCDPTSTCNSHGVCNAMLTCQCFNDTHNGFFEHPFCSECIWNGDGGYYPPGICNESISSEIQCNGNGVVQKNGDCICFKSNANGYFTSSTCDTCVYPWKGHDCKRHISNFYVQDDLKSIIGQFVLPRHGSTIIGCSNLFSDDFLNIIGHDSYCMWDDNDNLKVIFGSISNYNSLLNMKFLIIDLSPFDSHTRNFINVTLSFLQGISKVRAIIEGPEKVNQCSSIYLDGSRSSGDVFEWECISGPLKSNVSEYMLSFGNVKTISIPHGLLSPSFTYGFKLTTSYGGNVEYKSSTTWYVMKASVTIPNVWVKGGTTQYVIASKFFKLQGKFHIDEDCFFEDNRVDYSWIQIAGPKPLIPFDNDFDMNKKYLSLPSNSLLPNVDYTFQFIVHSRIQRGAKSSSTVTLKVVDYDIECKVLGGKERLIYEGRNITFIIKSNMHQNDTTNTIESIRWKCRKVKNKGFCISLESFENIDNVLENSRVNILSASALGIGEYNIEVTYILGSVVTTCSQIIIIDKKSDLPEVFINEINEAQKISLDGMVLFPNTTLQDGLDEFYRFEWALQSPKNIRLETLVVTPLDQDTLVFDEKKLLLGQIYKVNLRVYDTRGFLPSGFASAIVRLNVPPLGGTCSISPGYGIVLESEFTIICSNWIDENLPIEYSFGYIVPSNSNMNMTIKEVIMQPKMQQNVFNFVIPITGLNESDYKITITYHVSDRKNAVTSNTIDIHVFPNEELNIYKIFEYYNNLLYVSLEDFEETLYVLSNTATMIESNEDDNEDGNELRIEIINQINDMTNIFSDIQNDKDTTKMQTNIVSSIAKKSKNDSLNFAIANVLLTLSNLELHNIDHSIAIIIIETISTIIDNLISYENILLNESISYENSNERRSLIDFHNTSTLIETLKSFTKKMKNFDSGIINTLKNINTALMRGIFAGEKGTEIRSRNIVTSLYSETKRFHKGGFSMSNPGKDKKTRKTKFQFPKSIHKKITEQEKKKEEEEEEEDSNETKNMREINLRTSRYSNNNNNFVRTDKVTYCTAGFSRPPFHRPPYQSPDDNDDDEIPSNEVSYVVDVVVLDPDGDEVDVPEVPNNETIGMTFPLNKTTFTFESEEEEEEEEDEDEDEDDYELKCCFWDEKEQKYSTKGCKSIQNPFGTISQKSGSENEIEIECKCTHLTSFAVIGVKVPPWSCGDILKNESHVCSGNGQCLGPDYCECDESYYGENCEIWKCNGKENVDINVCNGDNGICIGPNECICHDGYEGRDCEIWKCNGIFKNDSNVCSGFGICSGSNECTCFDGFEGNFCNSCQRKICNSGGDCSVIDISNYHCICDDYIDGDTCMTCYVPNVLSLDHMSVGIFHNGMCSVEMNVGNSWKDIQQYCKYLQVNVLWNSLNVIVIQQNESARKVYCSLL